MDEIYMAMALELSKASKDNSRQTACLFVGPEGSIRASSFNQFPFGLKEEKERFERPLKYYYTEHAERSAIYAAARVGISLLCTTAYMPWFPCADCARSLVQVGVERV